MVLQGRNPSSGENMAHLRVILFDIDGTLISKQSTRADERERFARGVSAIIGKTPRMEPWRYDGMVDPEICRLLMIDSGLSASDAMGQLHDVIVRVGETYLASRKSPVLNEGVDELLSILKRSPNHRLGVLTGNLAVVAEEKLRITGIRQYFDETFYSDGYHDRADLVRDAVNACMKKYELDSSGDVIIVGDTPRDMEAANANNARSLGIATGFYSGSELAKAGAAEVFPSLRPSTELLHAFGLEGHKSFRSTT
jgi:phosphoglycolate phosphatase-like HAD superfamily hydrolase